jgi:propanediol utilization protein
MAWRFYTIPGDPSKPFESPELQEATFTNVGDDCDHHAARVRGGGSPTTLLPDPHLKEGSMLPPANPLLRIPVAVSARHAHLTQPTIERLFGVGYALHHARELSQPHEFAAQETVTLIGPRGRLEHVRVLGPPRHEDQIELARSDALHLGVDPALRTSGDLHDTPGVVLQGPAGSVELSHGVILARRHLHVSPADAQRFGVQDHEIVAVAIDSDGRDLIFDDVIVRVAADFRTELHLDTDEGNAAAIGPGATATLMPRRALPP